MRKKGFTLIELLVVIAIIALLLSVLLPALKAAKRQAAGIVCLANENQLSKAWFLYAEDHDSNLVDGQPDGQTPYDGKTNWSSLGKTAYNFVSMPVESDGVSGYSLEEEVEGLSRGALWPYLKTYKVYHCPADIRNSRDEMRFGYRTYSIGAVYSLYGLASLKDTSTWEGNVVATKFSEIISPSDKFVWLEEMDVSAYYNENTWNIFLPDPKQWYDPVAIWHGDSSTFGFADGHAERRKWVNDLTKERGDFAKMLANPSSQKIGPVPKGETEDFFWVIQHYIPTRIPAALEARMSR